jgi:hypothetical protein
MITYDDLSPLQSCRNLRHFSIFTHLYPLSIDDDEFALLVSAWPSLTHLHLNPDPLMLYDERTWPKTSLGERKGLTSLGAGPYKSRVLYVVLC